MKKPKSLSQQIERYVMLVALIVEIVITLVMVVSSFMLTDSAIHDTIQLMGKTTAQDIGSNLHLLTERMSMLSLDDVLKDSSATEEAKLAVLEDRKTRIEYIWLAMERMERSSMVMQRRHRILRMKSIISGY